jgi:hypothetical protein
VGRFLSRRDSSQLGTETTAKALERAQMMSTGELGAWAESIGSSIAVSLNSYALHHEPEGLLEARRNCEILHGVLSQLIERP